MYSFYPRCDTPPTPSPHPPVPSFLSVLRTMAARHKHSRFKLPSCFLNQEITVLVRQCFNAEADNHYKDKSKKIRE